MTEPGDGSAVVDEADIPPTRKHDSLEPAGRASRLSMEQIATPTAPTPRLVAYVAAGIAVVSAIVAITGFLPALTGPAKDALPLAVILCAVAWFSRTPAVADDGPVAHHLRAGDHTLGLVVQAFVFGLLAIVTLTAAVAALSDKLAHHQLGRWWFTVVRGGTFSVAIFGAVFATHQQRHLQMDLVSRRLSPRGRLVLGILLKLLTIFIMVLFFRSGMHQRATVGSSGEALSLLGLHITDKDVVTTIPIGAVLIIVHSLLHLGIDADYLVRGKAMPERMRSH